MAYKRTKSKLPRVVYGNFKADVYDGRISELWQPSNDIALEVGYTITPKGLIKIKKNDLNARSEHNS